MFTPFLGYICYVLSSELRHFISVRQHHLVDPTHSASAQANTVLVTGIPTKYLSEAALTHLFSHVPGGVKKVWVNRHLKHLPDVYDRRLAACSKLESAEHALIKAASKQYKKTKGDELKQGEDLEDSSGVRLVDRLVPRNKRPTHRLPLGFMPFSLPLIGKKVDTIEWARAEIIATNAILERERRVIETETNGHDVEEGNNKDNEKISSRSEYPPLSSAFILFHQQIGAHLAAQSLTHHEPFRMASKYTEVAPADVVWANLGLNPYEARVRAAIGWGLTLALVVLWAIPSEWRRQVLTLADSTCPSRVHRYCIERRGVMCDVQVVGVVMPHPEGGARDYTGYTATCTTCGPDDAAAHCAAAACTVRGCSDACGD
jgi:calcium permeable stress-gated cation channel